MIHIETSFRINTQTLEEALQEIIGADVRCTNHTLKSFGICVEKAVIYQHIAINHLRDVFGKDVVRVTEDEITYDWDFMKPKTVKNFVLDNPTGHYYIGVQGHAMGLHDGKLVDTSRKGLNTSKIRSVHQVINNDRQLQATYHAYEKEHPENIFDKPSRRRPNTFIFGIEDVYKEIEAQGHRLSRSQRWVERALEHMVNHYKDYSLGKKVSGKWRFSKKQLDFLVDVLTGVLQKDKGKSA